MTVGETIARETFWNITMGLQLTLYAVSALTVLSLIYGTYRHYRLWKAGRPEGTRLTGSISSRILGGLKYGLAQRKLAKYRREGFFHLVLYAGFIVLTIATVLVFFDHDLQLRFLKGQTYLIFEASVDILGLMWIVGAAFFLYDRLVTRPRRLVTQLSDITLLLLLLVIGTTGYVLEALRLAATEPSYASWSPIGKLLADTLYTGRFSPDQLRSIHASLWTFHAIVALGAVAVVPHTKLMHTVTAGLNSLTMPSHPSGGLPLPFNLATTPIEKIAEVPFGAQKIWNYGMNQLLSLDACTECGRCTDVCPAANSSKPLSPKMVVLKLRDHMHSVKGDGPDRLYGQVVSVDELDSCTTCRACVEECPVLIDHIDLIVGMRRNMAYDGALDMNASKAILKAGEWGNPYGVVWSRRMDWASGLDVKRVGEAQEFEVLYWVGCAASSDERVQKIARSMVKLMDAAGVKFAVLGEEEKCTGDAARRLGDELTYQTLAVENIQTLTKYGVRKIVTHCPHCFNAFKNDYPQLGFNVEVVHHSVFLEELMKDGRLSVEKRPGDGRTTFHDPCYLGRHNNIFDAPRNVLESTGSDLVEMKRSRSRSFCCGAGGGRMWMSKELGSRISDMRVEEAAKTGAKQVATACPFCLSMVEEARVTLGLQDSLKARDIAEILADSLPQQS